MLNHDNDNAIGEPLRFLSVCSGIEAASVAWHQLGWQAVAFSEIEKFPSAVLAHHYPDVPNLGDFTKIDTSTLGRVDILCGGTPCQAFSVAGLRRSLDDARGNLSLSFVRLAHELADNNGLRNAVWENVPGVLSTKDNAFGCFLAGIVGADDALLPSPKPDDGKSDAHWKWSRAAGKHTLSWPTAGMVSGPQGRAAWRIQDAQFHGLAQRRRRVLLVADFGRGADPAAVLFELVGMQGNPAPSREARKDIAVPVTRSVALRGREGGGTAELGDEIAGTLRASSGGGDKPHALTFAPEIARCVATREGSSQDYETTTMVAVDVAPTMRAGGNSTGGDRPYGTDVDTCDSLAVVSIHSDAIGRTGDAVTPGPDAAGVVRLRNPGMGIIDDGTTYNLMASGQPHAVCVTGDITHTLKAEGADASNDGAGRGTPIIAFDTTQITSAANRSNPQPGDPCHPISAGAHPPAITIPIDMRQASRGATMTNNRAPGSSGGAPGTGIGEDGDPAPTLSTSHPVAAFTGSAVRRLTPTECERLQGFPDGYTNIPWRGKPTSPDGPRYKALGNSWAVPKFTWLGRRIAMHMPARIASPLTTRSEAA